MTKREKQLVAEFPALAEMMALSVTAGESALAALERICLTSRGELAREFSEILAQTRTGVSLLERAAGVRGAYSRSGVGAASLRVLLLRLSAVPSG